MPTNDYIIQEGQGQIDWCFSQKLDCKSAQVSPTQFLVWNLDEWGLDLQALGEDSSLNMHLPIFFQIRILDIHILVGKKSLGVPVRNGREVDTTVSVCLLSLITASVIKIKCLVLR